MTFDANDCRRADLPLSFDSAIPIKPDQSEGARDQSGCTNGSNGHGHAGSSAADGWPDPTPLGTPMAPPAFPIEALPVWLRAWVSCEAIATQTPPDLSAMLALATIAAACARKVRVRIRGDWGEPLNVFFCGVSAPATRKSAVFRDATNPLVQFERECHERLRSEISRSADTLAIAQKRLARAIERAAKTDDPNARLAADADVRDARNDLARAEANLVVAPRLVCADVTQEALAVRLAEQHERIAVMDAEGCGPIALMLGRYSDGATSVDLYLRGHAGDPYAVDRKSGPPLRLDAPAITLALCVQPEVLCQLGGRSRELRGLGLLARVLWCVPVSNVGSRCCEPAPMPKDVRATYEQQIRVLLDSASAAPDKDGEPYTLCFADAAWAVLREFMQRLEPQLGAGGELEHLSDWAGKLAGAVARIAGLLHLAEHGAAGEISADTVARAVEIGDYLLGHARIALEAIARPALADAQHVLRWLIAHGISEISRRDLHRALRGRFPVVNDLREPLRVLAEHDWIRILEQPVERSAAPRTAVRIQLHPRARTEPLP